MLKKSKKIINILLIVTLLIASLFSFTACKKKVKHRWIEVGADMSPQKVTPGVHPERGSDSNAVPVILVPIYYPTGRNDQGLAQYKKYFYEMEELTPDNIDIAMKQIGLIGEDSLFCDLLIEESDEVALAGPGASESMLTKRGIVRYVDLSSPIDNSDSYAGKILDKDLVGLIEQEDVEYCILQTFEENFQLVSCDIEPVDMQVYIDVHGSANKE